MVKQRIMVLGAGAAGLAAARDLADHALEVVLVEEQAHWGGRAAQYGCKATDRCTSCGVCLLLDLLEDVGERKELTFHPETELVSWRRQPQGGYTATLANRAGQRWDEAVSALVVATGFDPFSPRMLPDLGHGQWPQVVGADQLEEQLRREGALIVAGKRAVEVAFVQCAGSRNRLLGADYCSEVCCTYALRMALSLVEDYPDTQVTIFYMDWQTHARGVDVLWQEAQEKLRLIRGMPVAAARLGERLRLKYEDVEQAEVNTADFDALVLSQGIRPRAAASELGRLLGINRNEYGFFARGPEQESSQPGIYIAGCAGAPGDIRQSIASGRACAAALLGRVEEVGPC